MRIEFLYELDGGADFTTRDYREDHAHLTGTAVSIDTGISGQVRHPRKLHFVKSVPGPPSSAGQHEMLNTEISNRDFASDFFGCQIPTLAQLDRVLAQYPRQYALVSG